MAVSFLQGKFSQAKSNLSVQLENQTEHTVSSGMLRSKVDCVMSANRPRLSWACRTYP
jgi:hypothetical protein